MSGGVDSSVAAGLLRDAGHDVVGATLKLWGGVADSGCCSVADVDDARRVAQVLGVDHHVFNYTEEFERHVVAPFVAGHAAGLTPNPCIECNKHLKFDLLIDRATRLGFDAVATGHHARVLERAGRPVLARGADAAKDQSYVLGYLSAPQLARLALPIGAMTKDAVRREAERLGLRTWNKPDSQDVCFIEAARGREVFLRSRIPVTPATVVDTSTGDVLGHVDAAELVTVGQRRGVAPGRDGERRYVTNVDLAAGRVDVGRLEEVMVTQVPLAVDSLSVADAALGDGERVWVQASAHGVPRRAALWTSERLRVVFDEPVRPIAPGQSVVFYADDDPEVVLGAAAVARP